MGQRKGSVDEVLEGSVDEVIRKRRLEDGDCENKKGWKLWLREGKQCQL